MKIALTTITTPAQPLGVGRYIISLLDALQDVDTENEYYVITSSDNHHLFELKAKNFKEIRTLFRHSPRWIMRPAYFAWQNTFLQRQLARNRIDVFHLPNLLPLLTHPIPTVVTIHDLGEYKIERKYGPFRQWYRKTVLPITAHKASRVITVSNNSKRDLMHILNVPENRIDVTYEGISKQLLTEPSPSTIQCTVEKYTDRPYILYAGALHQHKNVERLIRAYCRLRTEHDIPHRLLIVGRNVGQYEFLVDLVHKLALEQNVLFAGFVPDLDLVCLYRGASVVAYVPLNEGFGLPIIESMANGTPVVASNISSIPEIADNAALLVNPFDVADISEGIHRMLIDRTTREHYVNKGSSAQNNSLGTNALRTPYGHIKKLWRTNEQFEQA